MMAVALNRGFLRISAPSAIVNSPPLLKSVRDEQQLETFSPKYERSMTIPIFAMYEESRACFEIHCTVFQVFGNAGFDFSLGTPF